MRAEIYWIDHSGRNESQGRLAVMPRPRGGDWLVDELRSMREQGVDALVSLLTSDEVAELELGHTGSLARDVGIEFQSFEIADRTVPKMNARTNDFLAGLVDQISAGKSVAVHCRMGIGRSSLVVAAVLSLAGHAPSRAFDMITTARGVTVPDTDEQREWVEQLVATGK